MPTLTQRSLTSLTPQECQTLFAVAFGYAPPIETMHFAPVFESMSISDGDRILTLIPDGQVQAWQATEYSSVSFNARKLIAGLDAMNVAFGPYGDQPVPTVQFHEKAPSGSIS